jgi:periplasmic divalent cation tolerance protein
VSGEAPNEGPRQPSATSLRISVVLCNAPPDRAEAIAQALLDQRLAACVNIIPGVTSLYWWKGAITRDVESTLLIKTRTDLLEKVTSAIRAVHPYQVPEVIAIPLEPGQGNLEYHAWVVTETLEP